MQIKTHTCQYGYYQKEERSQALVRLWRRRVVIALLLGRVQLFYDPMGSPGSSVHGIFQARILEPFPFPETVQFAMSKYLLSGPWIEEPGRLQSIGS